MSARYPGKKVIAVLPAYHAVKTLKQTIDAIPADAVDDILLVDDASSDDTAGLARALGIHTVVHQQNTGYGGNQKTCYREALARGADIAVMVHPDFQYDPTFIPQLVAEIAEGRADACFGSRMARRGGALAGGMPYWKYLANIFLTALENFVLGFRLSEYHSGFRAYSKEVLSTLPLAENANGFVFDSEIIVQLRIAGFSIREVPITTRYFKGASMIGFWRSVEYGLSILLLLAQYLMFIYGARDDRRFRIRRFECPMCGEGDSVLWFRRTRSFDSLRNRKEYRITENAVHVHDNLYRCLRCKGMFAEPPREGDIAAWYASQPCDREYVDESKGRRRSFENVIARIERMRNKGELLDFGCGPGFFLAVASEHGWQGRGIELSKESVAFARSQGLRVEEGGIENLAQIPDGSFDCLTAFDVIEHLPNPRRFLREALRILRPGGVLVITTPRLDSMAARLMRDYWYAIIPSHLLYYTRRGLINALENAGFAMGSSQHFKRYFSPAYLFFRVAGYFGKLPSKGSGGSIMLPIQLFDELEVYAIKPRP